MNLSAPNDPWTRFWSGFPSQVSAVTTGDRIKSHVYVYLEAERFEFLVNPSGTPENFRLIRR